MKYKTKISLLQQYTFEITNDTEADDNILEQ